MYKYLLLALMAAFTLAGCGAPLLMSESRRFQPAPEIIERLRPYLADWVTLSPEETEQQRTQLATQLGIAIELGTWPTTNGDEVNAVGVGLEARGEWSRGYLYVQDNAPLQPHDKWVLRLVEEGLYLYNRIE